MIYGSVCSGIEAASVAWEPLGWKAAWFSEIEPFPCAVLKHRYPNVPNLGDMTRLSDHERIKPGSIDLLVGGTPCQSFAGLRKGLADPRGNLALVFLGLLDRLRPRWVVWENVPGILSDSANALKYFLDGLQELGYIIDIDILDARFFGVPQRRRRVFVCAQSVESLLNQMTPSSALTTAQCLIEILHGVLVGVSSRYGKGPANCTLPSLSKDGMRQRMKLFGLDTGKNNYKKLRELLVEAFRKFPADAERLELPAGASEADCMADARLTVFDQAQDQYLLTDESLRKALDAAYEVMKSSITSTTINSTTQQQIFTCFQAVLLIGKLICRLRRSCPTSWSAGLSFLTALREFTDYARQTDGDLFARMGGILPWCNLIREAEQADDFVFGVGDWRRAAAVLFEPRSLSGHPPPGREAGEGFAGEVAPSLRGSGPGVGRVGDMRGQDPVVATLGANYGKCQGTVNQDLNHGCSHLVAGPIRGGSKGQGGSGITEDVALITDMRGNGDGNISPTLSKSAAGDGPNDFVPMVFEPVAFTQNQAGDILTGNHMPFMGANQNASGRNTPKVQSGMAVRRLTPKEAERLQGFPDDWTLVPFRGKPAADGPRYKSIGNSMAVPVMAFIGQKIQMVEEMPP